MPEATYHRVGFARASLPVSKQTAIVAFPGIVKDLLAQCLVNHVLVCILRAGGHENAVFVLFEAVVWPEWVIESERAFVTCIWVHQKRSWSVL